MKTIDQLSREASRQIMGLRVNIEATIADALREHEKELQAELERERMCHAACGVIAISNTPESLARNREMLPEYLSASVEDCIRAAEREIALKADKARIRDYLNAYFAQPDDADAEDVLTRIQAAAREKEGK